MSRALERATRKHEVEDLNRLREAFYRIETDPNLRFFMRWLLETCGYGSAPATPDSLTMARGCGMLSVASVVIEAANSFTPSLYPTIIKETSDERRSRATELDSNFDRSDSGQ